MLVLDASAVIELLFQTNIGKLVAKKIFSQNQEFAAPELLPIEAIHVIRKYIRSKELTLDRAAQAFDDLRDFPIIYYPHNILIDRIWTLRENFTAYDAAYIALAEALNCPLVTTDSALSKGAGKLHEATVLMHK